MTEPDPLDRHRPALLAWAEAHTPDRVRVKLDPADLIHQTLLDAVRGGDRLARRYAPERDADAPAVG
jgi:hypothetical protein